MFTASIEVRVGRCEEVKVGRYRSIWTGGRCQVTELEMFVVEVKLMVVK